MHSKCWFPVEESTNREDEDLHSYHFSSGPVLPQLPDIMESVPGVVPSNSSNMARWCAKTKKRTSLEEPQIPGTYGFSSTSSLCVSVHPKNGSRAKHPKYGWTQYFNSWSPNQPLHSASIILYTKTIALHNYFPITTWNVEQNTCESCLSSELKLTKVCSLSSCEQSGTQTSAEIKQFIYSATAIDLLLDSLPVARFNGQLWLIVVKPTDWVLQGFLSTNSGECNILSWSFGTCPRPKNMEP